MIPPKLSKKEIEQEIQEIFASNPSPSQIKKAKKLAMSKNIKLGNLKKKYCKKCYNLFKPKNIQVRIKKNLKLIKCKNCDYISRYKFKKV